MLKIAWKLIVSASLVTLLILQGNLQDINNAIEKVGAAQLLLSSLILFGTTPILAWRWHKITSAIGLPVTFKLAGLLVLIGSFFNQILPSSIGGDGVRAWLLRKKNIPLSKGGVSILLDRLTALISMLIIILIGMPILNQEIHSPVLVTSSALLTAVIFGGIGILLTLDKLPVSGPLLQRLHITTLRNISESARKVMLSPARMTQLILSSVIIHLIVTTSVWTISSGMGVSISFESIFLILPAVIIISLFPVSFAGWGVREGAFMLFLGAFGVPHAEAIVISIAYGLASLISSLPGLLPWAMLRKS